METTSGFSQFCGFRQPLHQGGGGWGGKWKMSGGQSQQESVDTQEDPQSVSANTTGGQCIQDLSHLAQVLV